MRGPTLRQISAASPYSINHRGQRARERDGHLARGATFDQDLGGWDVSNVSNMFRMFDDSGLSTDNYDATLIGWAALPTLQRSVTLSADGVNYCESGPARQSLADVYDWKIEGDTLSCVPDRYEVRVDNEAPWGGQGVKVSAQLVSPGGTSIPEPGRTVRWSVTNGGLLTEVSTTTNDDGVATVTFIPATTAGVSHVVTATDGEDLTLTGEAPTITTQFAPFITIWNTDDPGAPPDNEITIPTIGGGYEYYVSWVEVGNPQNNGADGPFAGDATITFPRRGTYEVRISGDFPRIYIYWYDDSQKIRSIEQWGDIAWSSMEYAFSGAANLKYNATDTPDLTLVTDLRNMFSYAHSLSVDLRGWDVGNVTTMAGMFSNASTFNGDISDWDVSRVTDMSNMFESARAFNRDLSDWDVSNVTDMSRMFTNAHAFNQYLDWDVSSVTDMRGMFLGASSFNQDLGGWNVSNVRDMVDMFDVTALSSENYDATLAGWAALPTLQRDVSLGAADVSYCEGAAARRLLINEYNWEMIGDSFACEAAQYIVTVSDQLPPGGQGITVMAQFASAGEVALPVAGRTVNWSATNGGNFSAESSPTDADGIATVTFVPSTKAGVVHTVKATDDEDDTVVGQSPAITTRSGAAAQYIVTVSDMMPDSGSDVVVSAQLADMYGNPVAELGRAVNWSATNGGSFGASSTVTDADGIATVTFTTATVAGTEHVVTATDDDEPSIKGESATITTQTGAAAQYVVTVSDMTPDSGSDVVVSAQLADVYGNPVAEAGRTANWSSTNGGSFGANSSMTDAGGIATVLFKTATAVGTVHVVTATDATDPSIQGESPAIAVDSPIDVGVNGTRLDGRNLTRTADGEMAATIVVQLRDRHGNDLPQAGVLVRFATTLGELSTTDPVLTDEHGAAHVSLTSSSAGEAEVTAQVNLDGIEGWRSVMNGGPVLGACLSNTVESTRIWADSSQLMKHEY